MVLLTQSFKKRSYTVRQNSTFIFKNRVLATALCQFACCHSLENEADVQVYTKLLAAEAPSLVCFSKSHLSFDFLNIWLIYFLYIYLLIPKAWCFLPIICYLISLCSLFLFPKKSFCYSCCCLVIPYGDLANSFDFDFFWLLILLLVKIWIE